MAYLANYNIIFLNRTAAWWFIYLYIYLFTCSEKVSARSVSTDPLGGSTISWDLKIRLEPCREKKKRLVFNLGAAFFPGLTLHLCYCYLLPNKNPLLTKSGTIKYVPGFWRLWPQRSALYPVLSSPPASSESGCTTCTQRETQREVGISSLPPPPVSFLICTHRWIIHTRKQTVYSLNRHNK